MRFLFRSIGKDRISCCEWLPKRSLMSISYLLSSVQPGLFFSACFGLRASEQLCTISRYNPALLVMISWINGMGIKRAHYASPWSLKDIWTEGPSKRSGWSCPINTRPEILMKDTIRRPQGRLWSNWHRTASASLEPPANVHSSEDTNKTP